MVKKSNFKKGLCKDFMKMGRCAQENKCTYAHGIGDLTLSHVPLKHHYKQEKCKRDEKGMFCPLGAACVGTHEEEDSYPGYCAMYRLTKRCYFPLTCDYEKHEAAKPAAPYAPNRSKFVRRHEEFITRSSLIPKISQLTDAAQKYLTCAQVQNRSNNSELQNTSNELVSSAEKVAKSLEFPSISEFGIPDTYIRCLQELNVEQQQQLQEDQMQQ